MTEKTIKVNIDDNEENDKKDFDQSSVDSDSGIEDKGPDESTDNEHGGAPIDRGWAWVVLAGCVFEYIVFGGLMRSFGVFFLQYQMRFNSSASETAVMNLIQNIVISTTALFVMTIGLKKFSSRVAVFTGGTLTVIAYLITAFATDIRVFYVAQGVIGGMGFAMIMPPMLAIIGVYFNKHRGLANSILTAGGSIGGLIFAPIVVKLFEEYAYTGAMLITAGLLMNIWVCALLLRPIESYSKKKMKFVDEGTEITEEEELLLNRKSDITDIHKTHLTFHELKSDEDVFELDNKASANFTKHHHLKSTNFTRMQSYDPGLVNQTPQGSPLLQRVRAHSFRHRKRTISEDNHIHGSEKSMVHSKNVLKGLVEAISRSQVDLYPSGEGICGSYINVDIPQNSEDSRHKVAISETEIADMEAKDVGCCLDIKSCILSVLCTVFDIGLLRNPVFITYLFMAFSMMSGVALVPVYVPTHGKDIGLSNEKLGLLISLMAVIDLISKITMGVITDRKWIKRSTLLVMVTIILGTTSHLMRFINSFETMIVYVIIAGACCGQYMSVYAVLLMDVIGPEKFKSSLGFGTLIHGTSLAIFFPVAGLLRDITGSYVASFHLLGGLAYIAGILAFFIPIVNRWKKKREAIQ